MTKRLSEEIENYYNNCIKLGDTLIERPVVYVQHGRFGKELDTINAIRDLEDRLAAAEAKATMWQERNHYNMQENFKDLRLARIEELEWVADNAPMTISKFWQKLDHRIAELKGQT